MIYSLLVLSSPVSGQGARSAVEFAQCLLERGHSVHRVFFQDAGTAAASTHSVIPQDEEHTLKAWVDLADKHDVELVLCISSALKYGMLDETEANRYGRPGSTINPVFSLSGLGQLIDACAHSDRLITFAG